MIPIYSFTPLPPYYISITILETVGSLDKHTFSIQLESSNYPTLNSNINGEIQTSENYLETKIKTKIGSNAFNFEQLFSSQATLQKQELLFKVYFGIPDRNLAYGIDFEHRLASSDFTNRDKYFSLKSILFRNRLKNFKTFPNLKKKI